MTLQSDVGRDDREEVEGISTCNDEWERAMYWKESVCAALWENEWVSRLL